MIHFIYISYFKCRRLKLYKDYVEMYRAAVECLRKNRLENENFQQFIEVLLNEK